MDDGAPKVYFRYRTSNNGIEWTSWGRTSDINVQLDAYGMCNIVWALSAGTIFQTYAVMTGPDKDDSEPSNTVMGIIPSAPIQSPPYLEVYPVYRDGKMSVQLFSNEFPTGVSYYFIWRREAGQTEWQAIGNCNGRSGNDPTAQQNKTYEYVIAWYDINGPQFLSDFSNIGTVTVPSNSSTKLLPPIRYAASFLEQGGSYYNRLDLGAGDMRATKTVIQVRLNSGDPYPESVYTWSEASLAVFGRYILASYQDAPVPYDKWQYKLKNRADGYTDSDWSEVFEITVPSLLPRLDTPIIMLTQQGYGVLIGWHTIENAVGYKLERMRQGESSWTTVAGSIPSSYTRWEDSSTSVGYTYYYRLTALGDDQYYQDSLPVTDQITIQSTVILEAPEIYAITEVGIDIWLTISNVDGPNTSIIRVEMSENNGAWRDLYGDYPSSMSETVFNSVVSSSFIMEGGNLRFRVRALPSGQAQDPSPYSEIASITVDRREWLLRWTGTEWDECTSVTGGWYSPAITDSEGTSTAGAIVSTNLGSGTMRLSGANNQAGFGFWMNRSNLTTGSTGLNSKYTKICAIGTLVKAAEGTDFHAWFGNAWTYAFAGGTAVDFSYGVRVIAGSDTGRGAAGELTDPKCNACGVSQYANRYGTHVYFYFANGYADIKGIYGILRE